MKFKDIGKLIEIERKKRGWEQRDLAVHLSREQQTISRWEKGGSRPKLDDLLRLVEIFSADINVWKEKAGYEIEEPDQSLAPYLPLHNLSPENFELFCRDLVKVLNPKANVHRFGTQGYTQEGIDFFAKEGENVISYQCKRHKQFGPSDIDEAVKATTFKANHHYMLLSRIASPHARKAILKYENWTIWDRDDIAIEVRRIQATHASMAVRLVDTYFSGWRERFLGISKPSPWLLSEEFFLPFADRSKLFSHGWNFVGRKNELDLLEKFTTQSVSNAFIISGRGGVGKSRLLREWAERMSNVSTVCFLSTGSEIEQKDIELLPEGPCYLVIDDAHDRTDILVTLNGVVRKRPEMKVILCTRPYGITRLEDELTKAGMSLEEEKIITLNDLTVEDAKDLSLEILNTSDLDNNKQYAQRIAEITKDCPLATVIGSRLVGERKIKPELLNIEKKFRNELLRSFRNIIAGEIGSSDEETVKDLLDLIAVIQPFNPNDSNFQELSENVLGRHFDKITRDISALEEAGVLLRRGYSLRIVPDLLGDYIRATASFDEKNNKATGYVDRIFEAVKNDLAINLLLNISQLDWRLSENGIQTMLLTGIWGKITAEIKKANNADRTIFLKKLKDVAFFQPKQLLGLVEYVKDNPATASEDPEYGLIYMYEHSHVLAELPEILKHISYNIEYLPQCVDMIWEISRGDLRRTNSHPNHGIRVLQDLAQFDSYELTGKTVEINKMMLEAVKRWISDPNAHNYINSPLDILDEFIAKESTTDTYSRGRITFHPFGVHFENTKAIREEALKIIVETAYSPKIKVALRAIKSLQSALQEPQQLYGRQIDESEIKKWKPFQIRVLDELESIAKKQLHPLIQLEIKNSLHWQAKNGRTSKIKQKARSLFNTISEPFDNRLMRALHNPFDRDWLLNEDGYDYKKATQINLEFRQDVVNEFFKKYHDPKEGFLKLDGLLKDAKTYEQTSFPITFFTELAKQHTSYSKQVANLIISKPDHTISSSLGYILLGNVEKDSSWSARTAQIAIKTGNELLAISVADYYWRGAWVDYLIEDLDISNLKNLLGSKNIFAKKLAIGSLGRLGKKRPDIAKHLLLDIDLGVEKGHASEYCEQFDKEHYFDLNNLSNKELIIILDKLVAINDIDDYHIERTLESLSERIPIEVVKFMIKRVEQSKVESNNKVKYVPFSYSLIGDFKGIKTSPDYLNILREIRNKLLDRVWQSHFWYPKLFKSMSGYFDKESMVILREWVESGEKEKIKAIGLLLHEAPEDFVFQNMTFVEDILQAAKPHGDSFYKSIRSDLTCTAIYRSKHGTPGQPMPEDVELKENSLAMLKKLQKGSPIYELYQSLVERAKSEIEDQLKRDEELLN